MTQHSGRQSRESRVESVEPECTAHEQSSTLDTERVRVDLKINLPGVHYSNRSMILDRSSMIDLATVEISMLYGIRPYLVLSSTVSAITGTVELTGQGRSTSLCVYTYWYHTQSIPVLCECVPYLISISL